MKNHQSMLCCAAAVYNSSVLYDWQFSLVVLATLRFLAAMLCAVSFFSNLFLIFLFRPSVYHSPSTLFWMSFYTCISSYLVGKMFTPWCSSRWWWWGGGWRWAKLMFSLNTHGRKFHVISIIRMYEEGNITDICSFILTCSCEKRDTEDSLNNTGRMEKDAPFPW